MSSFSVAFRGENAVQVAQVTNHLATMFLEENMKVREQQSFGTSEFLKTELQETKKQLEEKEKEIQQVKSQFILDLPESKQYNLEILTNLRSQLRDSQERLSHAQQEKLLVQAMASSSAPTVDLDSGLQGSPYQSEIDKLEARISELRVRYGETYPNVRKLQSELDRLKAKAAANEIKAPVLATAPKGRRNPVLEAQLQKLNDEIENQKKLQTQLQGQINFHVSKLERVPVFEQKISGTMREYDTMLNHYRSVLDKKLSAEMGNDLETRQKAERFLILEPAVVPEKPFGLHRLLIILAGLVGGLAGGIGLALAVEIADESVRNDHEAAEISRQPVLAVIPHISTTQELRLNRMRAFGAVAATTIGSVILGLLVSFVTRRWL